MPTMEDIKSRRGHDARGSDTLGRIEDIYLERETGEPERAAVKTGLFGGPVSFGPLARRAWTAAPSPWPTTRPRSRPPCTPTPTASSFSSGGGGHERQRAEKRGPGRRTGNRAYGT
jgi:hypothetical protein